ncbi:hypothetical protein [Desulfosudis oleivorans]|nr:hypothetical protein [Desulfosudis oleivorans]
MFNDHYDTNESKAPYCIHKSPISDIFFDDHFLSEEQIYDNTAREFMFEQLLIEWEESLADLEVLQKHYESLIYE